MKKEKLKSEKKGNNNKILIISIIAVLLVAVLVGTYAYFASRTEVSNTLNVVANIEHDNGTFITTATKIDLNVTSASMQEGVKGNIAAEENGVLNVEYLSGTENGITCKYDINYEWVSDNNTNPYTITNILKPEFTYEITDGSNTIISERNFVASSDRNKHKLGTGYIYNADTTNSTIKNYTINAKFYNIDEDQSLNADKNWTLKFYVDNVVCGVEVESTYTLSGVLLDDNNNPIPNATLVAFSEPIFTTTDANGRFEISGLEEENHNIYFVPGKSIVEIGDMSQNEISTLPGVIGGTFNLQSTGTISMSNNYSISTVGIEEIPLSSPSGNNNEGNTTARTTIPVGTTLVNGLKNLVGTEDATGTFIENKGTDNEMSYNWALINQEVMVGSNTYVNTIYTGANPDNYVAFNGNCENNLFRGYYSATSPSYKEYSSLDECQSANSYNTNCTQIQLAGERELWRIIGVYNEDTHGKSGEQLVKIIKNDPISSFMWDYKKNGIGSSKNENGSNEWSDSQLMFLLNGSNSKNKGKLYDGSAMNTYTTSVSGNYIIDKNNHNIFRIDRGSYLTENREENKTLYMPNAVYTDRFVEKESKILSTLSSTSQNMIEEVTWHLSGPTDYNDTTPNTSKSSPENYYKSERSNLVCGTATGDNCTTSIKSTIRSTTWTGKVGLMYPSDYGYATNANNRSECIIHNLYRWSMDLSETPDCEPNTWLWYANSTSSSKGRKARQWTISQYPITSHRVFSVGGAGGGASASNTNVNNNSEVRPVVYLKSSIKVTGGDGSYNNPYQLSM